jgi:hypothetical protein
MSLFWTFHFVQINDCTILIAAKIVNVNGDIVTLDLGCNADVYVNSRFLVNVSDVAMEHAGIGFSLVGPSYGLVSDVSQPIGLEIRCVDSPARGIKSCQGPHAITMPRAHGHGKGFRFCDHRRF